MAQLEAVHPCFKGCPAQTQPNRRSGNAHHTVHDVAGGPVRFVPVSRGMFLWPPPSSLRCWRILRFDQPLVKLEAPVVDWRSILWHLLMALPGDDPDSPASGTGNLSLPQVALQIAASVLLAALS